MGDRHLTIGHVRDIPVLDRVVLDNTITSSVTPSMGNILKLSDGGRMVDDDIMIEEEGQMMKNENYDRRYEPNNVTGGDDEQVMSMKYDNTSVNNDG